MAARHTEVVIEVVSNREGGEDTDKLATYAEIGIRYYVIYDPDQMLGPEELRSLPSGRPEFPQDGRAHLVCRRGPGSKPLAKAATGTWTTRGCAGSMRQAHGAHRLGACRGRAANAPSHARTAVAGNCDSLASRTRWAAVTRLGVCCQTHFS